MKTTEHASPLRHAAAHLFRITAAGALAAFAVAAFAAPAQAGDGAGGARATGDDTDWWTIYSADPDGARVTGDDTDWWRYH